jgi:hypothetical protein
MGTIGVVGSIRILKTIVGRVIIERSRGQWSPVLGKIRHDGKFESLVVIVGGRVTVEAYRIFGVSGSKISRSGVSSLKASGLWIL